MLLIRPPPFSDESLSSWRQRTGMENGFRRYPRMAGTHPTRDPDRLHSPEEARWLANELAISPTNLMKRTLDHLGRQVTGTTMRSAKHHWILPLGQPVKSSLSGPVYCPACLKYDGIPYVRISWRLAFLSTCVIHGVPLHDRCPSCKALVWPASAHFINASSSWLTLRYCQKCSQDLSTHTIPDLDTDLDTSNRLWNCLNQDDASTITGKSFKSTEMFNALWALCQLIIRQQSSHILQILPPFQWGDNAKGNQGATIELTPLASRRRIVSSATWMLEDWPHRFLDVTRKASISSTHMLATKSIQPYWMSRIVERDLTLRRRNRINNTDVEIAMHCLRSKNDLVSKAAVRRIFGVTENKIIDSHFNQRRKASEIELVKIIEIFDQMLSTSSDKKSQRGSLLRDYLIFMISVLKDEDIATVCSISEIEMNQFISKNLQSNRDQQCVSYLRLAELAKIYALEVRPYFLRKNAKSAWLLSRFGMPIKEHSIRRRLTRMMTSNFPEDLWKSADVFRKVF